MLTDRNNQSWQRTPARSMAFRYTEEPTEQDRRNAAVRKIFAERQHAEYAQVLKCAHGRIRPGLVSERQALPRGP